MLHGSAKDVNTFHSFRGGKSGEKIDFIFCPPWATVLEAQILHDQKDERYPSDHFPLSARVLLPVVSES